MNMNIIKFNNTILRLNGDWLKQKYVDPYNPLDLPDYTIRCKFKSGYTPNMGDTQTLVDTTNNIWDIYKPPVVYSQWYTSYSWGNLFRDNTYLLEVLGANSTNITDIDSMFYGCTSLTNVSLFDTSSVTDMGHTFDNCATLTSIPLYDTSNVTDMGGTFERCTSLTTVPLFNTSKVTDMIVMFWNCTSLSSVPLFDTSNVTNMNSMFYNCSSLSSVPLFDTNKVTNMGSMFYECTELTSIPLLDTSKVTNMRAMFWRCRNVESGALALYQQASSQTNPPTDHLGTFRDCGSNTSTGSAELAQIPSDWK